MKFPQLPIGARFEFEGKLYVKTGPIAAVSEEGGLRMIPRWAVLRPLDGSAPGASPRPLANLDGERVRVAFEDFHGECERLLASAVEHEDRLEAAREKLAMARKRFLAALEDGDGNRQ
jgi:hypothetical protein